MPKYSKIEKNNFNMSCCICGNSIDMMNDKYQKKVVSSKYYNDEEGVPVTEKLIHLTCMHCIRREKIKNILNE